MTRNLKTVSQFASESGVWSEASLRWMIFQAESNGLSKAGGIVRLGRRVYIDPAGFERWIASQNPGLQSSTERRPQA